MHLGVVFLVPSQRGMLKSARLRMKDRGDGCQCCPKYLGILRCVPREEVSLLQTSQHLPLGSKWVGGEQPQGRQGKAAAREWAGKRTQGDSSL